MTSAHTRTGQARGLQSSGFNPIDRDIAPAAAYP